MVWKINKEEPSPEEVLLKTREELSPFWIGLEPQFTGIKLEGTARLFPLNPDFSKKNWLLLFLEPTVYTSSNLFTFAKEWYRRYQLHGIEFLFVLIPIYEHWKSKEVVLKHYEKSYFNDFKQSGLSGFPLVIDHDQTIAQAFGLTCFPEVVLLTVESQCIYCSTYPEPIPTRLGPPFHSQPFLPWASKAELLIQSFLRQADPGLSLSLPLDETHFPPSTLWKDQNRIDFGSSNLFESSWKGLQTAPTLSSLQFKGNWEQDLEWISTQDPQASLCLLNTGQQVQLIAQTLSSSFDPGIIQVRWNNQIVSNQFTGENLEFDSNGQSVLKIKKPKIYQALTHLPEPHAQKKPDWIQLTFPTAHQHPIALFGIRFGAPAGDLAPTPKA